MLISYYGKAEKRDFLRFRIVKNLILYNKKHKSVAVIRTQLCQVSKIECAKGNVFPHSAVPLLRHFFQHLASKATGLICFRKKT